MDFKSALSQEKAQNQLFCPKSEFRINTKHLVVTTDISQYRLRFGSSLLYKSMFHLNRLTAQLPYEG
jgi:hypothetical protein